MPRMGDSYKAVRDAMAAGTPLDLICVACPWDRLCVRPPEMTQDDVRRHTADMEREAAAAGATGPGLITAKLAAIAIYGGRDTMGSMCPAFAARMQTGEGRRVADAIRAVMRGPAAD